MSDKKIERLWAEKSFGAVTAAARFWPTFLQGVGGTTPLGSELMARRVSASRVR
jgi:hypothetical protein